MSIQVLAKASRSTTGADIIANDCTARSRIEMFAVLTTSLGCNTRRTAQRATRLQIIEQREIAGLRAWAYSVRDAFSKVPSRMHDPVTFIYCLRIADDSTVNFSCEISVQSCVCQHTGCSNNVCLSLGYYAVAQT